MKLYERTTWSRMNTGGTKQRHSPGFTLFHISTLKTLKNVLVTITAGSHTSFSWVREVSCGSRWAVVRHPVPVVAVPRHHPGGRLTQGTVRGKWRRVLCGRGRVQGLWAPHRTIVGINRRVTTGRGGQCIIPTMGVIGGTWGTGEALGLIGRTHGARRGRGQRGRGPDVGTRGRGAHWWPQTVWIHWV